MSSVKRLIFAGLAACVLSPTAFAWENEFCETSTITQTAPNKALGEKWCLCMVGEAAKLPTARYEQVLVGMSSNPEKTNADIEARRTGPAPTLAEIIEAGDYFQTDYGTILNTCMK